MSTQTVSVRPEYSHSTLNWITATVMVIFHVLAVAALFYFRSVRVEYAVEDVSVLIFRRHQHQCLIESNAGSSIGEGAECLCVGNGGVVSRFKYDEVVAEPVHLGESEEHGARIPERAERLMSATVNPNSSVQP